MKATAAVGLRAKADSAIKHTPRASERSAIILCKRYSCEKVQPCVFQSVIASAV